MVPDVVATGLAGVGGKDETAEDPVPGGGKGSETRGAERCHREPRRPDQDSHTAVGDRKLRYERTVM